MQGMENTTRSYAGVAADERRATRRAALIEAALDLFAEDGPQAVSKRAVCARARLNDRYFYEHFADSDALVEEIVRELTAGGIQAVNAATGQAAPDLRAQIRATAEAALDFLTADPRRGTLLLGSHTSEVLQRARLTSTRAISDALSVTITELGASTADRLDTDLAVFALVSGVMELVAGWLRGDFDTGREHLADLIAGLLLSAADISSALSGLGETSISSTAAQTRLPSKSASISATLSASRVTRCAAEYDGIPSRPYSSGFECPAPRPSSNRPPDNRSTVALSRASSTGLRKLLLSTYVPRRSVSVTAAAIASAGSAAIVARAPDSIVSGMRKVEKPSDSARRAKATHSPPEDT